MAYSLSLTHAVFIGMAFTFSFTHDVFIGMAFSFSFLLPASGMRSSIGGVGRKGTGVTLNSVRLMLIYQQMPAKQSKKVLGM